MFSWSFSVTCRFFCPHCFTRTLAKFVQLIVKACNLCFNEFIFFLVLGIFTWINLKLKKPSCLSSYWCYMILLLTLFTFSFLIWQEIYSIKLPGNPKLGEGKPENQNHAIIFTRGNAVQRIDMNQVINWLIIPLNLVS